MQRMMFSMRELGVDQTNIAKICAVFHPSKPASNGLVLLLLKERNPGGVFFTYVLGFVCFTCFFKRFTMGSSLLLPIILYPSFCFVFSRGRFLLSTCSFQLGDSTT